MQPSAGATQEGIRRGHGIKFERDLRPTALALRGQQNTLSVGEPDSLSSQPFFGHAVLGLEKFDGEQLIAMYPTRHNPQQKRQSAAPIPTLYRDPPLTFLDYKRVETFANRQVFTTAGGL